MARGSKVELVEDAAGVRIDVTTPKRIDLALREAHERFPDWSPEYKAQLLELAEAFVSGEEGSRERAHSDRLFQIGLSGRVRGVWDLAQIRASLPGDVIGHLSASRYLDLAPQSEESRLFALLAEQETVRLRWVTEGVELLYRLPAEHRDSWRQALATNQTRTDDERDARYEELLAHGMATKSELPFYRRKTPRRPRRSAPPPATRIPFFAQRSGSVPTARRPTLAGVRLPPGRRAPDSLPSYWISDEPLDRAGHAAAKIAGAFTETGLWPLLWALPAEDPAAYLDQPVEPDRVGAVDVEAVFRRGWVRLSGAAGLVEPVGPHFPGLAARTPLKSARTDDPFRLAGLADVSARLMVVPCNRPSDCVALIGGLAVEVAPAEISAVIRSWEERFGAVLVAVEPSLATLAVLAPPTNLDQALAVAAERFAFCPPETVEPGSLHQHAEGLLSAVAWPVAWFD